MQAQGSLKGGLNQALSMNLTRELHDVGITGSWSQDPDNHGVLVSSMRGCYICQVEHVLVLIAAVSPTLRPRYQMANGLQGPSNSQRIPLVFLMAEEQ